MTARIKGTKLSLTIGSVEIHEDGTSVVMDSEEANGDVTTFADAELGGARQHFFTIGATQSLQGDSFWRMVWANTGEEAAFVYRPQGNVVATADEPHFTGTLTIGPKPALGGAAGTKVTFTFETRFDIDGVPLLDDGATSVPLITSVDPESPVADELVTIYGSRFTGTTAVSIDGTSTAFTVISDGMISALVPTAAAGAANIVVTNDDGASDPFAVTIAA